MKTNIIISAIAAVMGLMVITSCDLICHSKKEEPERVEHINLPDGVKMEVELNEQSTVTYTSATVSGMVEFSQLYNAPDDFIPEKHLRVEVKWGEDKSNLSNTLSAKLEDAQTSWGNVTIPFTATISGLVDGAVYYFTATAKYGDTPKETLRPVKFFTLPEGPVDLDLPSGNKWSSVNLGANYPEESGDYYAWGETAPRKENGLYDWTNYKWAHGNNSNLTKYCTNKFYGDNGYVDNLSALEASDDAASAKLGSGWHIPSAIEWTELNNYCGWEAGIVNGVRGWLVRSKYNPDDNKKVIFLPCHGYIDGAKCEDNTYGGYYWSSNIGNKSYPYLASNFRIAFYGSHDLSTGNRCYGESIRPVLSK